MFEFNRTLVQKCISWAYLFSFELLNSLEPLRLKLFVCFDVLKANQQFFSHAGTFYCLPEMNRVIKGNFYKELQETDHLCSFSYNSFVKYDG